MKPTYLLMALALGACGQQEPTTEIAETTPSAERSTGGCIVSYERDWTIGGQAYKIQTSAEGADCAQATATISLRAPNNEVIFTAQHPTQEVSLAFSPGADESRLQSEIEAWSANVANGPTAADLQPWPAGEQRPPAFQPAVTREVYEAARAASRPVFAYPDGGESNAYVAVDPSTQTAVLLGTWTPERP
jgi:hypothetical protein